MMSLQSKLRKHRWAIVGPASALGTNNTQRAKRAMFGQEVCNNNPNPRRICWPRHWVYAK